MNIDEHQRVLGMSQDYQIGHADGYKYAYDEMFRSEESARKLDEERVRRWEAFKAKLAFNKENQPEYQI